MRFYNCSSLTPTASLLLQWLPTYILRVRNHIYFVVSQYKLNISYFITNWVLSTNHRRISIMYFLFIIITAFTGLLLATLIRIELAIPGVSFFNYNAEKYLTLISLHAVVMVFFVVIPLLFGAFGNFLLPTQLGVRDVAFPRLNSFMFWVTPSGFILLMHIFYFDKAPIEVLPRYIKDVGTDNHNVIFCSTEKNVNKRLLEKGNPLLTRLYKNSFLNQSHICSHNLSNQTNMRQEQSILFLSLIKNKLNVCEHMHSSVFIPAHKILSLKSWINMNVFRTYRTLDINFVQAQILTESKLFSNLKQNSSTVSYPKISSWVSNQLIPGWAFITPYSSRLRFTSIGKVDVSLIVIFMAGLGSIFSAVNYVITYRCVAAPATKNSKELRSFFVDALLVGSRMMLAANPALLVAIIFLLCDRHFNTSIFDFSGGGDAVLFQHLFWFFGHPEVYIIVIPCFGFTNSILPHLLRKRLSGRLSLQYSMYTIGFMGFAVWGHHLYMVGLANTTRTLYSTMTVMISVPASTKVLHWCVTLSNSSPQLSVSLLFILAFIYFFTLGGLSGMFNAHIGFDVSLHDTFYVIGHFHVMLAGGVTSCIFAAFYFYYSSLFGVAFSSVLATSHFLFYFFGQLLTLIPMIWLGYSGMPRRIMDYPSIFGGWHSVISGGHFLSVLGFLLFCITLLESLFENRVQKSKTLGVPRLTTRLAFYTYERIKLINQIALNARLQRYCLVNSKLHFDLDELKISSYIF